MSWSGSTTLTLKSAILDAVLFRRRPAKVTVEALQDVSLSVAPGETVGLIGHLCRQFLRLRAGGDQRRIQIRILSQKAGDLLLKIRDPQPGIGHI